MNEPAGMIRFDGEVACRAGPGPLALVLTGRIAGNPAELAFAAPATPVLPDLLPEARIELLAPGAWRIVAGSAQWTIAGTAVHLHQDVGAVFYRAVPQRRVPWRKRLFFRAILAFAATLPGSRLLARRSRPQP